MNIIQFHTSVMELLPSEQKGDLSFREHLSYCLKQYRNLLNDLDESERPANWDKVIKSVDTLSNTIKEVIKRYYLGHQFLAYNLLRIQLEKMLNVIWIIPANEKWYRIRRIENGQRLQYQDMFHIPLDKRGIVKTERYSFPGYPCLYLGATVYDCWEEMRRPSLHQSYVSQFENTTQIRAIDMTVPDLEDWLDQSGKLRLEHQLPRIPLLIASMIKVKNEDDIFKPEYIIPQLLMGIVLASNKRGKFAYDGIYYSSVWRNDDFHFPLKLNHRPVMINLALPVKEPLKGKYCEKLCSDFKITNPTSDELERAKCGYTAVSATSSIEDSYENSVFGQLEKRLSNRKRFKLNTINYLGK